MADFGPDRLLANVPVLSCVHALRQLCAELRNTATISRVKWAVDARKVVDDAGQLLEQEQVRALLAATGVDPAHPPEPEMLTVAIAELDRRLGRQLEEILHHPQFRRLEAAWGALAFMLERVDLNENTRVDLLNVSKTALREDFEDAPEQTRSTLYQRVYTDEFGQFGGRPYSVMIADYLFGPTAPDVWLLQQVGSIGAMAHAPFVAGADAAMFQLDSLASLAKLRDLDALFQQPQYMKWLSFRRSENSRYVALTVPRFRLRDAYRVGDAKVTAFDFDESGGEGSWGNSAFAFATRLADSFAATRWCIAISGNERGRVTGLNMAAAEGGSARGKIPTEVLISDRREQELIQHGFIPLTVHKGDDTAAFYASCSIQSVGELQDDRSPAARLGRQLGAQLPYLFIVSRLAHYIKVMQREHLGSWRERSEIEREVNEWLKQYVSDMDNPAPGVRARRPLRRAALKVAEAPGTDEWYRIDLSVTPHLKYMGSAFTLAEVGKLERN